MKKVVSLLTLSSLLMALPLAVGVVDRAAPLASVAHAEEKKEPKYKDVQTRQRQSVGKKCAKSLESVQVLLEEERWPEALEDLKRVDASDKTCESDYEQTQVWKFMGYVYYSLDDMRQAVNPEKNQRIKIAPYVPEELGQQVIAEGIETVAEYETLRDMGITLFQGYLFGLLIICDIL